MKICRIRRIPRTSPGKRQALLRLNSKILIVSISALLWISLPVLAKETAAVPPLRILTEEWPPLNYSENGEIKGFATEVVKLVMKELKLQNKIEILPSNRGMDILNRGPRVMYYSFIMTDERKSLYKWIGPFGGQSIFFYKRKDSPIHINSLEDAKKVASICCRDRGLVYDSLKKAGFSNLDVGTSPEGIYLKAVHRRCELAIGETSDGVAYWLKKSNLPPDSLERTPVKISSSSLYLVVSKDVPDSEVLLWQKALDKVKASAEYSKLKFKVDP